MAETENEEREIKQGKKTGKEENGVLRINVKKAFTVGIVSRHSCT